MILLAEQVKSLNLPVKRLVADSREVQTGDTFVACPGEKTDGRQYIADAIARGANAVIWEKHHFDWNPAWQVPNLGVSGLREKAGWLADSIYGSPSRKMWVIGITGTNGKTSTCHWIAQALSANGKKCALIGTLGNGFPGELRTSANTTPDALTLHGLSTQYLQEGAQAMAMEVSSHALTQGRVNGMHFKVAMLTNLSRDHLDYHGDMQSYAAAKRKLFDWQDLKYAVLNLDDSYGSELATELSLQDGGIELIGYGMSDAALRNAERLGIRMVYGSLERMSSEGLSLSVHSSWGTARLNSGMVGRFNASNLLGTLAVLLVSGISIENAILSLSHMPPVAGRMQRLGGTGQPVVIVDYAHTPDALEKVLLTLRETSDASDGKLWCVFGCGGDRDRGKRPMMGLVAEKFSDRCIVTSDNPRSEDPLAIIAEIAEGMNRQRHQIIADRATAIREAIRQAGMADTILVAGKGHEDYQEICGIKYPFSDVLIAQQALKEFMGGTAS